LGRPQLTLQMLRRTVGFLKLAQRAAEGQHLCWGHAVLRPSAPIKPFRGVEVQILVGWTSCKDKSRVFLGGHPPKFLLKSP
jgi:hypothetical protein